MFCFYLDEKKIYQFKKDLDKDETFFVFENSQNSNDEDGGNVDDVDDVDDEDGGNVDDVFPEIKEKLKVTWVKKLY